MTNAQLALKLFIDAIESTGGVVQDEFDSFHPVGDPEWTDLGDAYIHACDAIHRTPKVAKEESDDDKDNGETAGSAE